MENIVEYDYYISLGAGVINFILSILILHITVIIASVSIIIKCISQWSFAPIEYIGVVFPTTTITLRIGYLGAVVIVLTHLYLLRMAVNRVMRRLRINRAYHENVNIIDSNDDL